MNYGEFGDVFARLGNLEECGSYWKSKCPAHDDESNSLSISVGDKGNLLVKCHAGCAFTDIVAASGIAGVEILQAAGEGSDGEIWRNCRDLSVPGCQRRDGIRGGAIPAKSIPSKETATGYG